MVVSAVAVPHLRRIVLQKLVQFEAVLEAGIDFRAKEVPDGVDAAVVREEDSVGGGGIGGET